MEEGDLLVLRVTIGVSFALLPLLNKSIRGSFLFFYCFLLLFLFSSICFSLMLCGPCDLIASRLPSRRRALDGLWR